MTELVPVTTARLVKQFVELPYSLYVNQDHWVPPLRRDEHRRLSPKHNAFLDHAAMSLWLARSDGRVTGRIAAIDDRLHNETHHEQVTWFGFFEAEDAAAADVLLSAVERHARGRRSAAVRGPVNPSLNESAGLLIDRFDEDPYVLMPYNVPEYARYIEGAGYRKVKDLLAWSIDLTAPLPVRITKIAERIRTRHNLVVRPLDLRFFERDLASIQEIYRDAWQGNWGFVPPTDAEVRQLATELRPVLDPNLVLFAELAGRVVACAVSLPDVNQVLKRMNGDLLPFGLIHFLRRKKIVNQARLVLLGVLSEVRRIGLYPLLIAESYSRAVALGYIRGEMSWTLEDNDLVNAGIEAVGGRRNKTYRLYEKPLG
jgi:hypothetical protein